MEIQGLSKVLNVKNQDKISNNINNNSFQSYLDNKLEEVNLLQKQDEDLKKMLAVGEVENIHSSMIATEKADLALQLTLNIRNKILDAYKEIMRMQI